MIQTIPENLKMDRYWRPFLFLFSGHAKLSRYFTEKYVNLEKRYVKVQSLQSVSRGWSQSEKFMLNLALHLFNSSNKLPNGLDDMDHLDGENKQLALKAIRMRFGNWDD